jgi:ribose transport system ATP-binding protein
MEPTPQSDRRPALVVDSVNKSFPGVQALKNVSLEVYPNEVVGLVGENGAGKSTLMRILAGVYAPDSGAIRIHGEAAQLRNPRAANEYGIGMVFQEQSLLPNIAVGENIYLGYESEFIRFGLIHWGKLYEAARRQLDKVQAHNVDPKAKTGSLDFAERQMVELAKALTLEERIDHDLIILLDEPTSVLEQEDVDILFERVRQLKERASFVFVSHRLDEILALSDRIYVMKDGEVVAGLTAAEASAPELHRLMVGRGVQAEYYRESQQQPYADDVVLQAEDLAVKGVYKDVNFRLHRGEVLSIAGVEGSGREVLARTLFGFTTPSSGRLLVNGRPVRFKSPLDAVNSGIGYIPRERRTEGLILFLPVAANMTLSSLNQVLRGGLIDYAREEQIAQNWIKKLSIRPPNTRAMCLNLSGGNQQKVVLAKWISAQSSIIILDHPTRGLDVGAKEEVYELVRELSNQGIAIVLTADTLEETIGLSHTILVMRDGLITQTFDARPGDKPEQVDLIQHMV